MNLLFCILFLVLLLHESYGVIYHLNASEFERMPPIYRLDDYKSCFQEPSDVYCLLSFQLVSDEPNELLHMIEEYSEHSKTHFDHTKLRYGMCVTRNCQNYIQNDTSVSEKALEGCLNQSFWEDYQLKTRIQNYSCYSSSDNKVNIDTSDVVAGIVVFIILVLCAVGSLYDVWCAPNKGEGKNIILSFSIQRNWKRLFSTEPKNEPRLQNLKGLNGMRCIGAYVVICIHSAMVYYVIGKNIHEIELSYYNIIQQILLNGPIMIQSYFVISAFLLTYNLKLYSEKYPIGWGTIFKGIFLRYIRLTPTYALVILLSATWLKFIGSGPLWEITGKAEMMDCKNRWWINLLYVNNYVFNYHCLPTSWYLAADMQLFCCGLVLHVLLKNSRYRKTILISLIVIGSIINAGQTYFQDLDFSLIFSPRKVSELFAVDPTSHGTYKTGHGNISSFVIGMTLGYAVYRWQQKKINIRKYLLFRYIYWSVVPLGFGVALCGIIFYRDGPREPLYLRVIFSAFVKPIIGILIAIQIAGTIFKLEKVYRKVYEWDWWTIPSRLTYGAYIVHLLYLTIYINMQTSLLHMTIYNVILLSICLTTVSFVTAIPLFVLVEAPCVELLKYFTGPSNKDAVYDNGHHKKIK